MKDCRYMWNILCILFILMGTIYLLPSHGKAIDIPVLNQETTIPVIELKSTQKLSLIREVELDIPEPEKEKNRWNLTLGTEEIDLLARIVMLEAGGESDLGQQAVVEVIFNRIHSELYPNTVYEVLSQTDCGVRQFSSWKNRNSQSADPSERVKKNVSKVLDGETHALPFDTLYFSIKGENQEVQAVIGNHVFCNQSNAVASSPSSLRKIP